MNLLCLMSYNASCCAELTERALAVKAGTVAAGSDRGGQRRGVPHNFGRLVALAPAEPEPHSALCCLACLPASCTLQTCHSCPWNAASAAYSAQMHSELL